MSANTQNTDTNFYDDRQLEIAIWPPKPEVHVRISPKVSRCPRVVGAYAHSSLDRSH